MITNPGNCDNEHKILAKDLFKVFNSQTYTTEIATESEVDFAEYYLRCRKACPC